MEHGLRLRPTAGLNALPVADHRRYLYARSGGDRGGSELEGRRCGEQLNKLKLESVVPKVLFCDNGSEFTSHAMDLWACQNGTKINSSRLSVLSRIERSGADLQTVTIERRKESASVTKCCLDESCEMKDQ